ncbi:MAG: ABC transporter permease [Limnochordia bacterium]|nr:ABC transporter permease [Limnochordia bacterium]HOB40682.1 ABC transporter permease [Limnochordia bacterium]HOM00561.1 ABC transporter permease [Limnochordia bacterium]
MKNALRQIRNYPSAVFGLFIILFLVALAIYAVIAIPYSEAVRLWRGEDNVWLETPRNARPAWFNYFYKEKRPVTIVRRTSDEDAQKTVVDLGGGVQIVDTILEFEYTYDRFPSELAVFLQATFQAARPNVNLIWVTPDGREIPLTEIQVRSSETYRISQDSRLERRLGGVKPEIALFSDPNNPGKPLKGTYKVLAEGMVFEEGSTVEASVVVYGQLHGLAGTDHRRRDLTVALLWGAPVALSFGLIAAVGSSLTTMMLAAAAVWFGGWVDWFIRRINEVVMILPLLPILIMVGLFYSRSIWVILGVVIALGIFGSGILSYRSMFLQVKESGYIEAARAYGAGNARIIFRYMVPRILPVLVPSFVIQVPSYVFMEATLSVLGLGDPLLPTWGKLLSDAQTNGALINGHFYWVLEPAFLLMLAGLGFVMLGFALDRIFNPRLRGL